MNGPLFAHASVKRIQYKTMCTPPSILKVLPADGRKKSQTRGISVEIEAHSAKSVGDTFTKFTLAFIFRWTSTNDAPMLLIKTNVFTKFLELPSRAHFPKIVYQFARCMCAKTIYLFMYEAHTINFAISSLSFAKNLWWEWKHMRFDIFAASMKKTRVYRVWSIH